MTPSYYSDWRRYVSMPERRRNSARKLAALRKAGREAAPVEITGRKIARTFWGEAWCQNLEAYSDYANRLPRGRTYVRNGSVIDLRIEAGTIRALVSGSEIYVVEIRVDTLPKKRWGTVKSECAGKIDSIVELLQGSISKGVMEIVTRKGKGLFPSPSEIRLSCSCPDWATMCKHVAATLYGIGARLDREPETLFALRGVDPSEMIAAAVERVPTRRRPQRGRTLEESELSSVFGIELDTRRSAGPRARRSQAAGTQQRNEREATKTGASERSTTRRRNPRKKRR